MNNKIQVACDVQPMIEPKKTGIGWVANELFKQLQKNEEFALTAQAFTWNEGLRSEMAILAKTGITPEPCNWFHVRLYKILWPFIPISYRLFFRSKPEVQIFFNNYLPPGTAGKTLLMVHDMAVFAYPETLSWRTKYMLGMTLKKSTKRADHLLTVSEFSKSEMVSYLKLDPEQITVVPNGVNFSRFHTGYSKETIQEVSAKLGLTGDYFLYLGTLEPRKNIPRLIEAYALLQKKLEKVPKLVLAGRKGWLYETIFERVKELGLEKDVIFAGYVSNEDTPPLMAGAKAFLFPSLYEGFGMPPLEAMACGTPVIVANTASLPEVVGDGGLYVDPFDIGSMVEAMERIVLDADLCKQLSLSGIEHASQFTWDNSGKILASVCRAIAGKE
ncbi:MAG TPA: glycosyltransferase family 1 protein [Sphaerochaeta sp.]|nr:glycosyltransferase family 1 protein [Sphaerochaeta sp.]